MIDKSESEKLKKKCCDRKEPWGAPLLTDLNDELSASATITLELPERNQKEKYIRKERSVEIKVLQANLDKAFDKYSATTKGSLKCWRAEDQ